MILLKQNIALIFILFIGEVLTEAYFSPCGENDGRDCSASTNRTEYLLSMKKGGSEILSTEVFMEDFFRCEQYNYDCGYLPEDESYVTIANGCQLDITEGELLGITLGNIALQQKIKPYLNLQGQTAKCGMTIFPLELTSAQSDYYLEQTMTNLQDLVINYYDADRDSGTTADWLDLNINIRTAVLAKLQDSPDLVRNSVFWDKLVLNQFQEVSSELKQSYTQTQDVKQLHQAYLIDAVTRKCNKTQAINFLMDQSGSIGPANFQLSLDFLQLYLDQTLDDFSLLSIHYFAHVFREGVNFGSTQAQVKNNPQTWIYANGMATYTGQAMIQVTDRIKAQNYVNGLPKIVVVMTDGEPNGVVSVQDAYQYASKQGIVVLAVGIGSGISQTNLLKIAGGISSNVLIIEDYSDLPKLVQFISNYFCKQIITVKINQTIVGNQVRVPTSPSYFRVQKSQQGQFYELDVVYEDDYLLFDQVTSESQIDPFPDQFTEYEAQYYQIRPSTRRMLTDQKTDNRIGNSLPTLDKFMKIFFIYPQQEIQYTVKKQLTSMMNASVSYISVAANQMRFNISLKECSTFNCSEERITLRGYVPPDSSVITNDERVILTPQEEDLSIFIIIGSTLAALALCCLLCIFGIRRMTQQEEQKKQQDQNILSENSQNIVPVASEQRISKSKKSSKKSSKSSMQSSNLSESS